MSKKQVLDMKKLINCKGLAIKGVFNETKSEQGFCNIMSG